MKAKEWMWILHEAHADIEEGALDRLEAALDGVVGVLEAHSECRVALALSGAHLEALGRGSRLLERVSAGVRRGQIEMLGGGFTSPIVAGIPEGDAVLQIRHCLHQIVVGMGARSTGLWLEPGVWDPALCPLLAGLGIRYTFLGLDQIALGCARVRGEGPWAVERLGYVVGVFGIDCTLGLLRSDDVDTFLDALRRGGERRSDLVVTAERLGNFADPNAIERMRAIAARLDEDVHRLRAILPERAMAARRCRERLALPASVPPSMAACLRERGGDWGAQTPDADADHATWDFFLVRYPEADLLHKKMLLASARVRKMAAIVRKRQAAGEDVSVMAHALERARRALFRAQDHDAYWPARGLGIYDASIRAAAHRALMETMRITGAVFYPEGRYVAIERIDLDRDGCDELLVETPQAQALITLQGGAMRDLSWKSTGVAFLDILGRRREKIHARLRLGGVAMPLRRSKSAPAIREADDLRRRERALEPRIRYDRYLRRAFLDHFLGVLATEHNFYQCQYPEIGDFIDGAYEVIVARYERRRGVGRIRLSRNGLVVEPGAAQPASIRVEKTFEFDDAGSTLRVRYLIQNRGGRPAGFRFGVEIGLNPSMMRVTSEEKPSASLDVQEGSEEKPSASLDVQEGEDPIDRKPMQGGARTNPDEDGTPAGEDAMHAGTDSANDDAVERESAAGQGGGAVRDPSGNASTTDPGALIEAFRTSKVCFHHERDAVRMELTLNEEAQWWSFVQESVSDVDGQAVVLRQGLVIMPWWEVSLWGDESRALEIRMVIRDAIEEPSIDIIEP